MDRRTFNLTLAGAAASSLLACATPASRPARTVLYQCIGPRLRHFDVDVENGTLVPRAAIELPSNIQYVWPHPVKRLLYAATSDSASGNVPVPGKLHRLQALDVAADGAVRLHGEARALPTRPIHLSLDRSGSYALTAYNNPSGVTVHRIDAGGTVGAPVAQSANLDFGIFAHQILAMPSNRALVLVTRGNDGEPKKPEDPGALKILTFDSGRLAPAASITAGMRGGRGYGPRHVAFHPDRPWLYVCVERQNQLHMHRMAGDVVSPAPDYVKTTLAAPRNPRLRQLAGAIHIHPNGRYVYVSNRADSMAQVDGRPVFQGGENNIAVYAIDAGSGEPRLVQHADTQTCHVRTFSIDPSGRLLVAAGIRDMWVRNGNEFLHVPAALSVFRIATDGRLSPLRKYDVALDGKLQWWAGMVAWPAEAAG